MPRFWCTELVQELVQRSPELVQRGKREKVAHELVTGLPLCLCSGFSSSSAHNAVSPRHEEWRPWQECAPTNCGGNDFFKDVEISPPAGLRFGRAAASHRGEHPRKQDLQQSRRAGVVFLGLCRSDRGLAK